MCIRDRSTWVPKRVDKHDIQLERELKEYKAEVELRFKTSKVNQTYIYPRNKPPPPENSNIGDVVVSIYDCNAEVERKKIKLTEREESKSRVNKFIKQLLRTREEGKMVEKTPFYCTQRLNPKNEVSKKSGSWLNLYKPKKKKEVTSRSEEPGKRKLPLLGVLKLSTKRLQRTRTVNAKDHSKRCPSAKQGAGAHAKAKSRTNMQIMQFSDNFRRVLSRQKESEAQLSSRVNVQAKTREHNQLVSTLSVPNFSGLINNINFRVLNFHKKD
eukprot:TRINITY_DN1196_c0_g1_i3.p1 TRINITY_DN1196_c0_g1~~TRINITY_DN1196_c0_g1_i3.p1  ORF type:complete len:270 (+),score=58.72 TRINITY_DN1196_c0_g1_i3:73-882(+)